MHLHGWDGRNTVPRPHPLSSRRATGSLLSSADRLRLIRDALDESARVTGALASQAGSIERIADRISDAFRRGHRLYACGNGGSACDSMHLVEELVARYRLDRPGLPAHHLLDAATLTCWSNDHEFETVFRRQVEAFVRGGDVLVAISTSGSSGNVIAAAEAARAVGALTIGLTGENGGRLGEICEEVVRVPSSATERIQEGHITVIHLLCELIERSLFEARASGARS